MVYQCAYSTIQPSISPVPSVYSSSDLAELRPPGIHPTVTQGRCYDLTVSMVILFLEVAVMLTSD